MANYFSELITIVADGTFNIHPRELGKNGQVYSIHGVTANGTVAPLMHIICNKKTAPAYEKIFVALRRQLEQVGVNISSLKIVTDFERTAMLAVDRVSIRFVNRIK